MFQSLLSDLILMASIAHLHPASLPSPPESHILLPSLFSTQVTNSHAHPNVLLKHLHSFGLWQLLQKLESASYLICLSHPTDTICKSYWLYPQNVLIVWTLFTTSTLSPQVSANIISHSHYYRLFLTVSLLPCFVFMTIHPAVITILLKQGQIMAGEISLFIKL